MTGRKNNIGPQGINEERWQFRPPLHSGPEPIHGDACRYQSIRRFQVVGRLDC